MAFAIVALVTAEGGYRLGRWWQKRTPDEQQGPTSMIVGSLLALLAFLLAITMGMASDRFDTRRKAHPRRGELGGHHVSAGRLPAGAGLARDPASAPRVRAAAHREQRSRRHPGADGPLGRDPGEALGDHRGTGPRHARIGCPGPLHRFAERDDRSARDAGHRRACMHAFPRRSSSSCSSARC